MGWWKERKERKAREKREKWEEDNLPDKGSLTNKSDIEQIVEAFNELELEVRHLKGKVHGLEKIIAKTESWKVIQDSEGKTEWYKPRRISYVSKIYTTGPENAFYFDAIIDGNKITFDAETAVKAEQHMLELLDVERVEDYNIDTQQEMFGEEIAKNAKREYGE